MSIDSKQLCKSVSPISDFWAQMQVVRVCRNLRTSDFLLSRDWIGAPRSYGHYIGIVHICGVPKGACGEYKVSTAQAVRLIIRFWCELPHIGGTANDRGSFSVYPNAVDLAISGGDRHHLFFMSAYLPSS